MKFRYPFFVTPHAVQRFQEHVAAIPADEVIRIIHEQLQNPGPPVDIEYRDRYLSPIFRCQYQGQTFYVPVCPGEDGRWPAVPTVIPKNSPLHAKLCRMAKNGKEYLVYGK